MNRQQFIGYLQKLDRVPAEASSSAEAVVEQYPFFHAAHLLLAAAYHQHQDVRSAQALRKAAAFLPSRALLYAYLNEGQTLELGGTHQPVTVVNSSAPKFSSEESLRDAPELEKYSKAASAESTGNQEWVDDTEAPGDNVLTSATLVESHDAAPTHEAIERRLSDSVVAPIQQPSHDLTGGDASPIDATSEDLSVAPSEESDFRKRGEDQADWLKTASEVSLTDRVDELDKEWLSKGVETGFSLGVSSIGKEEPGSVQEAHASKTFLDWLKAPKPEFSPTLKEDPKKKVQAAIIDRFIVHEPRISKPKAEFFTPQQAAKQSLVNDPNLASETLAGIYELQGNFGQAVKIYEALALKFPGKSLYFASLAKKAKEKQQQNRSK